MQSAPDTIAAIATPAGHGGVGIVRVSGPQVPAIARRLLGQLPRPRHAVMHGFHAADGELIDEGLVLYFPAPASFTGEHVLELHGHGGPVVMDLLLQRVLQQGARSARAGEFSEKGLLDEIKSMVPLYSDVCFHGEGVCRACVKAAYRPDDKSLNYVAVDSADAASAGLQLLVGKSKFQFGTSTTRGDNCRQAEAEAFVTINPADADKLGVADGASVQVKGGGDSLTLKACVCDSVPAGLVFAPAQYVEAPVLSLVSEGNMAEVSISKA